MTPNWLGLAAGSAAFFAIWLGHVGVRKIEAVAPNLWLPTAAALCLGLALETAALLTDSRLLSGVLGIVGMTLLWDALEFWRQQKRVAQGHAPANPHNPRHARLLAANQSATPINWLDREPLGKPATPDSIWPRRESVP
jgi:hypothetical protein